MMLANQLRAAIGEYRQAEMIAGDSHVVGDTLNSVDVPAAVLIAITDRVIPGVILTRRAKTMRRHPGQAAFPGGCVDPQDSSMIAAALREAEEEIGLSRHIPDVIGSTDLYRTATTYAITPVIAVIPPDLPLVANPDEVAAIFEVPLNFLLDPVNHVAKILERNGQIRHFYELNWEGHQIWGATAAMIVNLSRRLAWPL